MEDGPVQAAALVLQVGAVLLGRDGRGRRARPGRAPGGQGPQNGGGHGLRIDYPADLPDRLRQLQRHIDPRRNEPGDEDLADEHGRQGGEDDPTASGRRAPGVPQVVRAPVPGARLPPAKRQSDDEQHGEDDRACRHGGAPEEEAVGHDAHMGYHGP